MKCLTLPRSLAGRMTIAFVGVIIIAMLVLAVVVPRLARAHELGMLEDRLADEGWLVADYVVTELDNGHASDLDVLAKRLGQTSNTRITIIQPDGTVVGESHQDLSQVGNHASRQEVQQALAGGRGVNRHFSQTVGYEMLYVAVPILRNGSIIGVARTALPLSEIDQMVDNLTRTILLAAASSGLLAVIVAVFAARAITRPLARLTQSAAALADDPLKAGRFRRHGGPAEVTQLSQTMERMDAAIRDSLRQVAAERDRLDAVLANLADGIIMIDASGRVELLNAAARQLLGRRRHGLVGRTVAEVLRDHELVELVERARGDADPPMVTQFLELRNPRRFLRAAARRFGSGEAVQTLLVLQDLTELRRLETIRRDFVANVSHELRTPIASIKLMTETLQDGVVDDPEAARDFLSRIAQEIDGLHCLVEELLELSRLESGRVDVVLVPSDPRDLVEGVASRLAAMAERAGVSLMVEVPPGLPPVMADAERMGQVLVNLLHNAIKFTPRGGRIVVRAAAEDGQVRLSIADTGVGIDRDLLPRIFERFFKADHARASGGTGLGLAIAKHTVQLHGGRIWAESDGPGHGTTIHVSLPRAT